MTMAHIFRFILKRSFSNLTTNLYQKQDLFVRPMFPLHRYLLFRKISDIHIMPEDSIDAIMVKIDNNVKRYGRVSKDNIESALLKITAKKTMSSKDLLMLIRACGNFLHQEKPESRIELAKRIWNIAEELGVKFDVSHYNALLKAYLENGGDFDPNEFYTHLKKMNCEPNRLTYQRLIARYCAKGDIDGATHLLEEMRIKDVPINVQVFNSLIVGHSRVNDMESAERILNILKEVDVSPTGETMTCLINEYLRHRNLKKALEYLKYAKLNGVNLTEMDHFNIITVMAKEGYVDEVDEIIDSAPKTPIYHHEGVNTVLSLVSLQKTDVAFKLLKNIRRQNRQDGSLLPLGNFFLSHAVKCNVPTHLIVKYCLDLMKNNLNSFSLVVALEESLRCDRKEMALTLFRVMKKHNIPIRYHYFWPLIVHAAKRNDFNEMQDTLFIMNKEFNIRVNTETLREIIIPYMLNANISPDNIILQLKSTGASVAALVSSIVLTYLRDMKLKEAANIAEKYNTSYSVYFLRNPLVSSFKATKDVESFVKILKQLGQGIMWREENDENERDFESVSGKKDYREYTGQLVVLAVRELICDRNALKMIENLLQKLIDFEVGIHPGSAIQIENILQKSITPPISQALKKLVSDKYIEPPAQGKVFSLPHYLLDSTSMERMYETTKSNKENKNVVMKYLFTMYTSNKNLEGVNKILKDLQSENYIFDAGMYVKLINMYTELENAEKALEVYENMVKNLGTVTLDPVKLLKFVLLLVQRNDNDKALEILKTCRNSFKSYKDEDKAPYARSSLCRKILEVFIERDDLENLLTFRNTFFQKGLIDVNTIILGALIKLFLNRKDFESAFAEFERCVTKYRATPWFNELIRHCIEKEDASNLQNILELGARVHGESAAFHSLFFCFLEAGRIKDAQKILKTPTFKVNKDRFLKEAFKYYNEGEAVHLENFIFLIEKIEDLDHSKYYFFLLSVYDRMNDAKKGLSLWIKMQEEDLCPTNEFLATLAKLLTRNNHPVPFSVPEIVNEVTKMTSQEYGKLRVSDAKSALKDFINSKEIDKALELKEKTAHRCFDMFDWSMLIESCVLNERLNDAKKLFDEYFSIYKQLPLYKISKFLLGSLTKQGDVEFFNRYCNIFDEELKKRLSFDNHRCRTFLNANRVPEYLEILENNFSKIRSSTDYNDFSLAFPRGGILSIMMEKPEHAPQCEALLKKCLKYEKNSCTSANILWIYYMLQRDFDEADAVWEKYLLNSNSRISFFKLNVEVQRHSDLNLALKLVNIVEQKGGINPKTLGIIYGGAIAVLVHENKLNDALRILEKALRRIRLCDIMRSALMTLKFACDSKNVTFPYKVDNLAYTEPDVRKYENNETGEQTYNL